MRVRELAKATASFAQHQAVSTDACTGWYRLEKTTFLTPDEKRAVIGYAPLGDTPLAASLKYRSDQARDDTGRWTDEGGGEGDAQLRPVSDRLSGYPVELREEEARRGHTIDGHVSKSAEYLRQRVQAQAAASAERGG